MRQFKKKTLALVLASVVTVVGAFGADIYKNRLMALEFQGGTGNTVNVNLCTKIDDSTPVNSKKIDSNTYIIVLPEVNGNVVAKPKLPPNIQNIDIKTVPYTNTGKGYAKLTIKTADNVELTTSKTLYIPSANPQDAPSIPQQTETQTATPDLKDSSAPVKKVQQPKKKYTYVDAPKTYNVVKQAKESESPGEIKEKIVNTAKMPQNDTPANSSSEVLLILLGAVFVISVSVFLYIKGKNKMAEVLGEQGDFSFDTDEKEVKEKESKKKRIKETIKSLDKMYKNPVEMPLKFEKTKDMPEIIEIKSEQNETPEFQKDSVIVDLDELFQEQQNEKSDDSSEENTSLDEFLNNFNLQPDEETAEQESDDIINALFEKYIENGTVMFSASDIEKINKLLNSEISDDTLKNIELYAPKTAIIPKEQNHKEVLEDLITSYVVNQNLSFSKDDVDALEKLTKVELDPDFINNLDINSARTQQMAVEITSRKVPHKSREILTLNVKDSLPDLSEALKKQAGKRIESEVKPQVVYYSEGYDVSKLNVENENLPDLTLDFDNPEYSQYRPSDTVEVAESGYEVETLSIKDELPDLHDVIEHPEKYNDETKKAEADESVLLKNVENITFKPFYDGTENIDIANKFDDQHLNVQPDIIENTEVTDEAAEKPEISDEINKDEAAQPEAKQSEPKTNIKNVITEKQEKSSEELLSLLSEDDKETETKNPEKIILPQLNRTTQFKHKKSVYADANAAKLLKIIEAQKEERKQKKEEAAIKKAEKPKTVSHEPVKLKYKTCVIEGEEYNILSSSEISDNIGCYLAKKDDNYSILGYIGDRVFKIKFYEKIDSQRIQTRFNEKLGENTNQYIVRIGRHKFILNITGDKMEYVMDLC